MVPTNLVCSRQNLMCAASQGRVATSRLFHLNCFHPPAIHYQTLHSTLLYSESRTSLYWMQLYCSEPYGEQRDALSKLTTLFFTRLAPSPTLARWHLLGHLMNMVYLVPIIVRGSACTFKQNHRRRRLQRNQIALCRVIIRFGKSRRKFVEISEVWGFHRSPSERSTLSFYSIVFCLNLGSPFYCFFSQRLPKRRTFSCIDIIVTVVTLWRWSE